MTHHHGARTMWHHCRLSRNWCVLGACGLANTLCQLKAVLLHFLCCRLSLSLLGLPGSGGHRTWATMCLPPTASVSNRDQGCRWGCPSALSVVTNLGGRWQANAAATPGRGHYQQICSKKVGTRAVPTLDAEHWECQHCWHSARIVVQRSANSCPLRWMSDTARQGHEACRH